MKALILAVQVSSLVLKTLRLVYKHVMDNRQMSCGTMLFPSKFQILELDIQFLALDSLLFNGRNKYLALTIEGLTSYAYSLLFLFLNPAHGEFWEVKVGNGL